MYISLFTLGIPVNYSNEFQKPFELPRKNANQITFCQSFCYRLKNAKNFQYGLLSKLENGTHSSRRAPRYACILIKEHTCRIVFALIIDIDTSLIDLWVCDIKLSFYRWILKTLASIFETNLGYSQSTSNRNLCNLVAYLSVVILAFLDTWCWGDGRLIYYTI